jgi:hypothetical protein
MQPLGDTKVFFSCSFREQDTAVNDLIAGICAAIGIDCVNVSGAFARVPPDQARYYITKASGLIAVATRRDQLGADEFIMPAAVREEIAIAYGLKKPILIIGEAGVRFDGFMDNYGTRLVFTRSELSNTTFIKRLVASIHTFKTEVLTGTSTAFQYFASEYFAESSKSLISLDETPRGLTWTYTMTKRLRFEEDLKQEIRTVVWPSVPIHVPAGAELAEWSVQVGPGSRQFEITPTVRRRAPEHVELSLGITPTPQAGDFLEYTRTFRSRYASPIYQADLSPDVQPGLAIGERAFPTFGGVIPIERTTKLRVQYRFPASYRLGPDDVAVFVGSHSFSIEYLVPSELDRIEHTIEDFGGHLVIDIRAVEALPRHMYGVAWVPPA